MRQLRDIILDPGFFNFANVVFSVAGIAVAIWIVARWEAKGNL